MRNRGIHNLALFIHSMHRLVRNTFALSGSNHSPEANGNAERKKRACECETNGQQHYDSVVDDDDFDDGGQWCCQEQMWHSHSHSCPLLFSNLLWFGVFFCFIRWPITEKKTPYKIVLYLVVTFACRQTILSVLVLPLPLSSPRLCCWTKKSHFR